MSPFPANPILNQEVTLPNGLTYRWNGTDWLIVGGVGGGGAPDWGDIGGNITDSPALEQALDDAGRRGVAGTYTRGTHFDGAGLPTLQAFLDANINGRRFDGSVTIENGQTARPITPDISISNILIQGFTLYVKSESLFGGNVTISGVLGGIDVRGTWRSTDTYNFANHLSIQDVEGSVTVSGTPSGIGVTQFRYNDLSFFNCEDVRLDPGTDIQFRVYGTLTVSQSNLQLQGQGTASHNFNRSNINPSSRLDVSNTLGAAAVDLDSGGTAGTKNGWALDRRTNRQFETFVRRGEETGGGGPGGPLSGDVTGASNATVVERLRGRTISTAAPTTDQALRWDGSQWSPGSVLPLSGGTLTGNLYLPASTPLDNNQAISLGYLNTRINEFVVSGGNQFPDAPSAPPYTYGRTWSKQWQRVVTPDYTGNLNMYSESSNKSRITLGDSGYGASIFQDISPTWPNTGQLNIGSNNRINIGRGCEFTMQGGGTFRVNSQSQFHGFVRVTRKPSQTSSGYWIPYGGGGIILERNTRFHMVAQSQQWSVGPDNWPRAMFRVDSLAAFNGRQTWFNGTRTTFHQTAAFGGLVSIGDPTKGWRPQDRNGRIRVYRGNFSMDGGGRFRINSLSEFNDYITVRRRRIPINYTTGQPLQQGAPENVWNMADWSGGGGIVLDRGTVFQMAPQYGSRSESRAQVRRANFFIQSLAAFDGSIWFNGRAYTNDRAYFLNNIYSCFGQYSWSGANWVMLSDARLKTDIEPYRRGLADVLKLEPVWYRYSGKGRTPKDNKRLVGLTAQDVQPVMPEMVGHHDGDPGPTEFLENHPERIPKEDSDEDYPTDLLTLDTSSLIYAVVNSLKELNTRLERLETSGEPSRVQRHGRRK